MAEFPALTLWTDAYLSDTRRLTTLQHGAYLLLLMEAWRRPNCDLPADDRLLAHMVGLPDDEWMAIKPIIMAFWKHDKRRKVYVQKRLTLERDRARTRSRVASDKSAKRWNKKKNDDAGALQGKSRSNPTTATATATATEEEKKSHSTECEGETAEFQLEAEGIPPPDAGLKPEHFVEVWNETAARIGRPCIRDLTPERRAQLKARINGHTIEDFQTVLGKVSASPFLRGEKNWGGATFDWLIKKANFQKVLEGNYDG